MKKYAPYIFFLLFALLALPMPAMAGEDTPSTDEAEEAELQNLLDLTTQSVGTNASLTYADELLRRATEYGDLDWLMQAAMTKMTALHAMSKFDQLIAYADSITTALEMEKYDSYSFYFMLYTKCVTYIEMGKYRTATQLAQRLYSDSKFVLDNNDPDQLYLIVRCNALICFGLTNSEMEMYDSAEKSYTECIDAINAEAKSDEFLTQRLEAQTYRMQLAQKISDRNKALKMLDRYSKELDEFRSESAGTESEGLFLEDYVLFMEIAYVDILSEMNRAEEAYHHLVRAQHIFDNYEMVDQYVSAFNLAKTKYYLLSGNYEEALVAADSASTFFHKTEKLGSEVATLRWKLNVLHKANMVEDLYAVANRIIVLSDSLNDQRFNSSLEELQTIMNVDKLELEARTLQTQRQMWIFVSLSVLMAGVAAFFIFKRRRDAERQRILSRQKQMLEEEVTRQTAELRKQKTEIELKNRDITDSINYALRIQQSILPDMLQYKPEVGVEGAFAFFIPCQIVSGDFYWTYKRDNLLLFSCVDCTGHGVPGAFMSMIGTTILNDLCKRKVMPAPNELLELMHVNLLGILQQSGDVDSRDGMDMAILEYNIDTHMVRIASARRPVYIYVGGERKEFKGEKRSIGERDYTRESMPFSLKEIEVSRGDTAYLFSDGLADQFGGVDNKRLKQKGLVAMLDQIVQLPISEQEYALACLYWDWRGEREQIDDVSLMGIKF